MAHVCLFPMPASDDAANVELGVLDRVAHGEGQSVPALRHHERHAAPQLAQIPQDLKALFEADLLIWSPSRIVPEKKFFFGWDREEEVVGKDGAGNWGNGGGFPMGKVPPLLPPAAVPSPRPAAVPASLPPGLSA